MKKVLFLDVDGVLNNDSDLEKSRRLGNSCNYICPHKLGLLKSLVDKDTKIVVSSDWRLPEFPRAIHLLRMALAMFDMRIYGVTEDLSSTDPGFHGIPINRSSEIRCWLYNMLHKKRVHFDRFVVLDDRLDAGFGIEEHLVHTRCELGLTPRLAEKATEILSEAGPSAQKTLEGLGFYTD